MMRVMAGFYLRFYPVAGMLTVMRTHIRFEVDGVDKLARVMDDLKFLIADLVSVEVGRSSLRPFIPRSHVVCRFSTGVEAKFTFWRNQKGRATEIRRAVGMDPPLPTSPEPAPPGPIGPPLPPPPQ